MERLSIIKYTITRFPRCFLSKLMNRSERSYDLPARSTDLNQLDFFRFRVNAIPQSLQVPFDYVENVAKL